MRTNIEKHIYLPYEVKERITKNAQKVDIHALLKPIDLIDRIKNFADEISHNYINFNLEETLPEIVILHNFPIDFPLPNTPMDHNIDYKQLKFCLYSLLLTAKIFKLFPLTYHGENDDCLYRSVAPLEYAKDDNQSAHGGSRYFPVHMDLPDRPLLGDEVKRIAPAPDYSIFSCIRNPNNIPTDIYILDDILKTLDSSLVDILCSKRFKITTPSSFDVSSRKKEPCVYPLVKKYNEKFICRYDELNCFAVDSEAEHALNLFKSKIDQANPIRISINPGEIMLFSNQKTVHSRASFSPNYDGTDRWLIRLYGIVNSSQKLLKNCLYRNKKHVVV
ncbi:hypothetical protein [Cysteiniphilum sp. 19S12-1]|uniref:hypothetical protein n=1 Tax=Cysteiniphilum sp. 19S12-1 TaxID=3453130 RepID=UPI003F868120